MASGRGEGRQRQAVGGQAGPRGWAANLHHIELVGGRGLVQHHLISNQRDDATLSIYLHVISLVAHLVQRRLARQLVRRDRVDPTVQQPTDEGHVPWLWPAACLASPPSPFLPTHEHTVCMDGGGASCRRRARELQLELQRCYLEPSLRSCCRPAPAAAGPLLNLQ